MYTKLSGGVTSYWGNNNNGIIIIVWSSPWYISAYQGSGWSDWRCYSDTFLHEIHPPPLLHTSPRPWASCYMRLYQVPWPHFWRHKGPSCASESAWPSAAAPSTRILPKRPWRWCGILRLASYHRTCCCRSKCALPSSWGGTRPRAWISPCLTWTWRCWDSPQSCRQRTSPSSCWGSPGPPRPLSYRGHGPGKRWRCCSTGSSARPFRSAIGPTCACVEDCQRVWRWRRCDHNVVVEVGGDDNGEKVNFRSSCKINSWCILASSGSIWQYLAWHPQGEKLTLITCAKGLNKKAVSGDWFISTKEWEVKKDEKYPCTSWRKNWSGRG